MVAKTQSPILIMPSKTRCVCVVNSAHMDHHDCGACVADSNTKSALFLPVCLMRSFASLGFLILVASAATVTSAQSTGLSSEQGTTSQSPRLVGLLGSAHGGVIAMYGE